MNHPNLICSNFKSVFLFLTGNTARTYRWNLCRPLTSEKWWSKFIQVFGQDDWERGEIPDTATPGWGTPANYQPPYCLVCVFKTIPTTIEAATVYCHLPNLKIRFFFFDVGLHLGARSWGNLSVRVSHCSHQKLIFNRFNFKILTSKNFK